MSQKGLDFGEPPAPRQPAAAGEQPEPVAGRRSAPEVRRQPEPARERPKAAAHGRQPAAENGRQPAPPVARRRALTVSQLTERIQSLLETELVDFWVEGEVSNVSLPASGHVYFSLKDERAQIKAVIWKSDLRYVRFRPRDGQKIVARGQLRVYEKKGEYQVQVQLIEPLGKGALQQAFEELKQKLAQEGLFDPARKRPLPLLPRRIGVVTSPTGAVIQDMLRVLRSRHAGVSLLVYPARVQGEGAAAEIVQGVRALNRLGGLDVLVVARGGGSLEDLWPFNEEAVARALAASKVPTVSAVGHETDYTIADFVADLRAATPSAAIERVVPSRRDLGERAVALERRLSSALERRLQRIRARVQAVTSHRVFEAERGRIRSHAQRVDSLLHQAERALLRRLERARAGLGESFGRLSAFRLEHRLAERRARLARCDERLLARQRAGLEARRAALSRLAGMLDGLSPLAVLGRGYALVWDASGSRLVRRAQEVSVGDGLRVRLHEGTLRATVVGAE